MSAAVAQQEKGTKSGVYGLEAGICNEMRLKSLQYIVNITVQNSIRNTDFSICILVF